MNTNIFITVVGLIITGYGALISVYGSLKTKNKQLFFQVCTLCGYNGDDFIALLSQKYYSMFGFILILIGTIIQIIGNLAKLEKSINNPYIYLCLIDLLLIIKSILLNKIVNIINKREFNNMKKYYIEFENRKQNI